LDNSPLNLFFFSDGIPPCKYYIQKINRLIHPLEFIVYDHGGKMSIFLQLFSVMIPKDHIDDFISEEEHAGEPHLIQTILDIKNKLAKEVIRYFLGCLFSNDDHTNKLFQLFFDTLTLPKLIQLKTHVRTNKQFLDTKILETYKHPRPVDEPVLLQFEERHEISESLKQMIDGLLKLYELIKQAKTDLKIQGDISIIEGIKYNLIKPYLENLPEPSTKRHAAAAEPAAKPAAKKRKQVPPPSK
jgi:hypothetical protein